MSTEVRTRTLDQHISYLRKKLGKEGKKIRSVTPVGYSFEVEEVDERGRSLIPSDI